MIIHIPFQLLTLNEIIAASTTRFNNVGGKKRYTRYNEAKRAIEHDLTTLMNPLYAKDSVGYPVEVACHWTRQNRRHDPDNIAAGKKFILDAMVKADILTGDGWGQIDGFQDSFSVGKPGVRVELRRPRRLVFDDMLKLIFSSGMYVERVYNADPTFEVLEKVENDLQTVQDTLVDMVRGERTRFDYMESLITPEWRT